MAGPTSDVSDCLRPHAEVVVNMIRALVPSSPFCALGTALLVAIFVIFGILSLFGGIAVPRVIVFILTAVLMLIIGHVFVAKRAPAAAEHFYHAAPHEMVVVENPVYAHEPADLEPEARIAPWDASEAEVAGAIRQMQELTPPELLDAAQDNSIESSESFTAQHCKFPDNFSELGERLG